MKNLGPLEVLSFGAFCLRIVVDDKRKNKKHPINWGEP